MYFVLYTQFYSNKFIKVTMAMYKKPIKGPFKNDVTRVREDGVPKISDKK